MFLDYFALDFLICDDGWLADFAPNRRVFSFGTSRRETLPALCELRESNPSDNSSSRR